MFPIDTSDVEDPGENRQNKKQISDQFPPFETVYNSEEQRRCVPDLPIPSPVAPDLPGSSLISRTSIPHAHCRPYPSDFNRHGAYFLGATTLPPANQPRVLRATMHHAQCPQTTHRLTNTPNPRNVSPTATTHGVCGPAPGTTPSGFSTERYQHAVVFGICMSTADKYSRERAPGEITTVVAEDVEDFRRQLRDSLQIIRGDPRTLEVAQVHSYGTMPETLNPTLTVLWMSAFRK